MLGPNTAPQTAMPRPSLEKRRSRRFPSDVRLRSPAGVEVVEVVEMEAVNLSLGGACCVSPHRFEPMTVLDVQVDLPGRTPTSMPLRATAVVVRVEPSRAGAPYRIALWFREMADEDRARLRRHLGVDGN
jgi:hypothetical protein